MTASPSQVRHYRNLAAEARNTNTVATPAGEVLPGPSAWCHHCHEPIAVDPDRWVWVHTWDGMATCGGSDR